MANTQKFLADDVMALFGLSGHAHQHGGFALAVKRPGAADCAADRWCGGCAIPKLAQTVFNLRGLFMPMKPPSWSSKLVGRWASRKLRSSTRTMPMPVRGWRAWTQALASQGLKPAGAATVERNSQDVSKAVKALARRWVLM